MRTARPPMLAAWLLSQLTADEALIGDLVERYQDRRSAVWFWKQVLWTLAISSVQKIRTNRCRLSFRSMEFNPKALWVSVVAISAIQYASEHPSGVVAVFVSALLFWGRLIPEHWLTKRERPTR
jgi:hypothetical protein